MPSPGFAGDVAAGRCLTEGERGRGKDGGSPRYEDAAGGLATGLSAMPVELDAVAVVCHWSPNKEARCFFLATAKKGWGK